MEHFSILVGKEDMTQPDVVKKHRRTASRAARGRETQAGTMQEIKSVSMRPQAKPPPDPH